MPNRHPHPLRERLIAPTAPAIATTATAQFTCITKPYHIEGSSLAPTVPKAATLTALAGQGCTLNTHIIRGALIATSDIKGVFLPATR